LKATRGTERAAGKPDPVRRGWRGRRLAALAWACLLIAGCSGGGQGGAPAVAGSFERAERPGRYLKYRMPQDPPSLDPHDANDENSGLYIVNVFDGLVEFAPGSGEIAPAIAESWEISPEGKIYTFHLRKGVRFHNGRELVAGDVVFSFHRALGRHRAAVARSALMNIVGAPEFAEEKVRVVRGISSTDERTVVIELEKPSSTFLPALATGGGSIVPREIYDTLGNAVTRSPVGSGPFVLEEYASGLELKLRAFDDHWKGAPRLAGFTVRIIPDANTALREYRAGSIDILNEVPAGMRREVREEFSPEYLVKERLSSAFLLMNQASGPFKGNAELRRAVSQAVDRRRIALEFQEGKDLPSSWILPPAMADGRRGDGPVVHDPGEAGRMLTKAGYPGGEGLPEMTLLSPDNESIVRWVSSIRDDLKRAGLRIVVETMPFGAYVNRLTGDPPTGPGADLAVLIWFADYPDPVMTLGELFRSGSSSNFSGYSNAELDLLLDRAGSETHPGRRQEFFLAVEKAALDDAAIVALYHQGDDLLVKPDVGGIVQSPMGDFMIPMELVRLRK
jgi:ABC-type transport system substrate-binding protein